jgi:uncharacterized protein YodC (DUF2158 family)
MSMERGMSDFKKGDLVYHKSGGPKMVVGNPNWVSSHGAAPQIWCRWWGGDKFEHLTFDPAELKLSIKD